MVSSIVLMDAFWRCIFHSATLQSMAGRVKRQVCGELDALEIVLDAGADACTADVHGAYPLHYAAQMCGRHKGVATAGRDDRVGLVALKKLLARGVSVNVVDCDGRQPLLWAASSGNSHLICCWSVNRFHFGDGGGSSRAVCGSFCARKCRRNDASISAENPGIDHVKVVDESRRTGFLAVAIHDD